MSSFLLFRAPLSSGLTEQTQLPVAVRVMSPRSLFFSGRTERVAEIESTSLRARTGYKGYTSDLERKALKRVWKWSVRMRRNFYPHANHTREARTVPDLRVSSDLAKKERELYLSVNGFSTKVLVANTILTSPTGDGTAISRGHQNRLQCNGVPSFLSYFKTPSIDPKSFLFWVPTCVPGFKYAPWLAC